MTTPTDLTVERVEEILALDDQYILAGRLSSLSAPEARALCNLALGTLRRTPEAEGVAVAWACETCNSPRLIDPCQKCGTPLTRPADGWEWPGLPDIVRIRQLAREVGYAVGVHGSQERDFDLIAAPWVADAVSPPELAQHIASGLGGIVVDDERQDKPCGRWACNIHTPDWTKMIDMSVMFPASDADWRAMFYWPDAKRRQWWISQRIDSSGKINRGDICRAFGISVPQASNDIQTWIAAHPGTLTYDKSAKCYVRAISHARSSITEGAE